MLTLDINNVKKLQWACRRGMLELDYLLSNFLTNAYVDLSDAEKHVFIQLLSSSDGDLFDWLMGNSQPSNSAFAIMVAKILKHAKSIV
jgi:antitoxin CptB